MAIQDKTNNYLSKSKVGYLGGIPTQSDDLADLKKNYTPSRSYIPPEKSSTLGDYGRTFLAATTRMGGGIIETGRQLGLVPEDIATKTQVGGEKVAQKIESRTSPEFQKKISQPLLDKDNNINPEFSSTTLLHHLTASAPDILATMGGAGGLSKVAKAIGIAKKFGISATTAGAVSASEGIIAGSEAAQQHRIEAISTPLEVYRKNSLFHEELSKVDISLPLDQREEIAKENLANKSANEVFANTALSTGIIGLATGGGALGTALASKEIAKRGIGGIVKAVAKGMGEEAIQEAPQSYNEQLIANTSTKKYIDPTKDVMDGVINAAAEGAAIGAVSGGVIGTGGHIVAPKQEANKPSKETSFGTGEPITNNKVKGAFNKYIDLHSQIGDVTSPDYQSGYNAVKNELNAIISKDNDDGVASHEASKALNEITLGHESLVRAEERLKADEKAHTESAKEVLSEADTTQVPEPKIVPAIEIAPAPEITTVPEETNVFGDEEISPELQAVINRRAEERKSRKPMSPQEIKDFWDREIDPTPEVPTETIAPEISVTPIETIAPEIPVTPTETIAPEIPVTPTETITPEIPVTPTETIAPEVSTIPKELPSFTFKDKAKQYLKENNLGDTHEILGTPSAGYRIEEIPIINKEVIAPKIEEKVITKKVVQHTPTLEESLTKGTIVKPKEEEGTFVSTNFLDNAKTFKTLYDAATHPFIGERLSRNAEIKRGEFAKEFHDELIKSGATSSSEVKSIFTSLLKKRLSQGDINANAIKETAEADVSSSTLTILRKESESKKVSSKGVREGGQKVRKTTKSVKLKETENSIKEKLETNDDIVIAKLTIEELEDEGIDENDRDAQYILSKLNEKANQKASELTLEQEKEISDLKDQIEAIAFRKEMGVEEEDDRSLKQELLQRITEIKGIKKDPIKKVVSKGYSEAEEDRELGEGITDLKLEQLSEKKTETIISEVKIDHEHNRKVLSKIINNIGKDQLDQMQLVVKYVEDFDKHTFPEMFGNMTNRSFAKTKAFFWQSSINGNAYVYLNGRNLPGTNDLAGTFAHETIGHFGLRKLFGGKAGYEQFLLKLLNTNPKMRSDILARNTRWASYLNNWMDNPKNDITKLANNEVIVFGKQLIPIDIAIMLADEHMAELSKEYFLNKDFLEWEVGFGMKRAPHRTNMRSDRVRLLNEFFDKIRHFLQKVFGTSFKEEISDRDLRMAVAQSIDNTFETLNLDHISITNKIGNTTDTINYNGVDNGTPTPRRIFRKRLDGTVETVEISYDIVEDSQLPEESIKRSFSLEPIANREAFAKGIESSFGNHSDTVRSRFWKNLNDKISNNVILSTFKSFGNMPFSEAYRGIGTVFKGELGQVEKYAKIVSPALKGLNSMQKVAVFEYFSTKGADPNLLNVSPLKRQVLIKAKEAIRELGKSISEMNPSLKEAYEKNEDAYLHIVFLKYIDQYRGSGKSTSIMSWAKKRKNLTERERLALGMIKDPEFIVIETLGILARDHALLKMFDTINKVSLENKMFWVLANDAKVTYQGKKYTIDAAQELLDTGKFIIEAYDKDITKAFEGYTPESIIQLKLDIAKLENDLTIITNKLLEEAHQHAISTGQTDITDKAKFLEHNYIRLPNKPQLGALSNKLVRKEIASDLDALTAAYDLSNKDNLERFFAKGGTLERINRLWKTSMVALNPGSWFRNIVGNFALLDLSTSTNKFVLMRMIHEEITGTMQNKPSEYWQLADKYGLFGTTWSAVELQDLHNNYGDELKKAKAEFEARKGSAIDSAFHFADERMISWIKMLAHKTGSNTSKLYALVEGTFKTVSFKDYIQTWESQNKNEFPNGIKDLDENQQQVLFSKAANHANDSLFDYSQVNHAVKFLRRVPFGSPFITFSYKAGPAAIKAMINHPIKFAQYATLPALLTSVSMMANDWDDDDIEEYKKALPDYYRHSSGLAFFPFKDTTGRVQILSLDYVIPWSQWATAARKVYQNFVEDGFESPVSTGVKSIGTAMNEFGFLGGPTPTAMAAMMTGKDSFTGQDIITKGASASQQLGESMMFAYNMMIPAWLSSHGWFAKMNDAFGDKPTTNRFGDIKYTPGQAVADITGFRTVGIDQRAGIENRKLGFEKRLKEVSDLRSKTIRDTNRTPQEKANDLKDIAARMKMIRLQMQKELQ